MGKKRIEEDCRGMEKVLLVVVPSALRQGPRGGSKGRILTVEKLNVVEVYGDPFYQTFSLNFSGPRPNLRPLIYRVFL